MIPRAQLDQRSRSKLAAYFGKKQVIKGFKCYGYPWLIFVGTAHDSLFKGDNYRVTEKVAETDQLSLSVLKAWANRGWVTIDEKISSAPPKHGHLAAKYVIRLTDEARDEIKKIKA